MKRIGAAVAAVLLIASHSTARADIIANAARQAGADADEKRCMQGELPGGYVLRHGTRGLNARFADYWRLSGGDDRTAVAKLFSNMLSSDVSLKVPDGPSGGDALKAFLAQRGPIETGLQGEPPAPIGLIVADDGEMATGVWDVAGRGRYVMDIVWERNSLLFGLGWRIVHLTLVPIGAPLPPMPTQYCHRPGDVKPAH